MFPPGVGSSGCIVTHPLVFAELSARVSARDSMASLMPVDGREGTLAGLDGAINNRAVRVGMVNCSVP